MMRSFRFRNNAACMYQSVRRFSYGRTAQQTANAVAYLLPTQTATEDVAALHSSVRELLDVHLISGTLGAGKSTFWYAHLLHCAVPQHRAVTQRRKHQVASACSRAYIRYACDDEELAVPSPTYTLLNTYKEEIAEGPQIHHLDMYRLNSAAGQHRLQLPELWLSGATLIEWPERLEQKPEAYFATQISTCSQVTCSSTNKNCCMRFLLHTNPHQGSMCCREMLPRCKCWRGSGQRVQRQNHLAVTLEVRISDGEC